MIKVYFMGVPFFASDDEWCDVIHTHASNIFKELGINPEDNKSLFYEFAYDELKTTILDFLKTRLDEAERDAPVQACIYEHDLKEAIGKE